MEGYESACGSAGMWRIDKMTNAQFANEDGTFIEACLKAGVKPTKRQASKWRMKRGRAWKEGR